MNALPRPIFSPTGESIERLAGSSSYNRSMTQTAIELLQKALALPERERAELAGTLIDSLDPAIDENLEQSWQNEIAQRMSDIESQKTNTIRWDEVRRDAQAILDGKASRCLSSR